MILMLQPGQNGDACSVVGGVLGRAEDCLRYSPAQHGVGGHAAGEEYGKRIFFFGVFGGFFDGFHHGSQGEISGFRVRGPLGPIILYLILYTGKGKFAAVDLDLEVFLPEGLGSGFLAALGMKGCEAGASCGQPMTASAVEAPGASGALPPAVPVACRLLPAANKSSAFPAGKSSPSSWPVRSMS